jgi:hypothetical protein
MTTVFSYLALAITFGIGVLGTLFDYVEKDEHGKRKYGRFHIPELTAAGLTCLCLLAVSFGASCVLAYHAHVESVAATAQNGKMAADLEATRTLNGKMATNLETTKATLTQTQQQLTNLQEINVSQFQDVATRLKDTTDTVLRQLKSDTSAMADVMEAAATRVDHRMRGAITPLRSMFLELFFLGSPEPINARADADLKREQGSAVIPPGSVELFKIIACGSPADVQLSVSMPISDEPDLSVKVSASRKGMDCSVETSVSQSGPRPPTIKPTYWNQLYFQERPDLIAYHASFPNDLLQELPLHTELNAGSFNPARRAGISVVFGKNEDKIKIESYFSSVLPRVIGFEVTPNDPRSDLKSVQAFLLHTVAFHPSINGFIYLYEQGQIKKDLTNWDSVGKGTSPVTPKEIPNHYREGSH